MSGAALTCSSIVKGSTGPRPRLIEHYCLRCSHRVADDTTMVCDGKADTKCSYCSKLHKPCLPVPARFTRKVNTLITLANMINNCAEPSAHLVAALVRRQKRYTKQVTAYLRVTGRHNLPAKPKLTVEMGLLLLEQLKRQNTALEGILDVMRYSKKLPK